MFSPIPIAVPSDRRRYAQAVSMTVPSLVLVLNSPKRRSAAFLNSRTGLPVGPFRIHLGQEVQAPGLLELPAQGALPLAVDHEGPALVVEERDHHRDVVEDPLEDLVLPASRLLGFLDPGQVPDRAREESSAEHLELGNLDLDGEGGAVLAHRGHLAHLADDPAGAGMQVPRKVAVVPLAVGRRHEHVHAPAHELVVGVAEDLLHDRVRGLDHSRIVDGEDRVDRGIDDGAASLLALAESFFDLLALGDVSSGGEDRVLREGGRRAPEQPPVGAVLGSAPVLE